MEIVLANPRGFCAGVDRAIAIVNRALECFNPPIYVRHEVVHNKFVVDDLRQRGAILSMNLIRYLTTQSSFSVRTVCQRPYSKRLNAVV